MMENELLWNETLKTRNRLEHDCLKNKHSYEEEIKISVRDNGLVIETIIGGHANGAIIWTLVGANEDFFKRLSEHVNDVKEIYERSSHNILKDK